jgi:dTDP-4-amino-4,6-dideoxygalactose transaminase
VTLLRTSKRIAANQATNLLRLATGRFVLPVPLGSMTLGPDDVEIARRLIRERDGWNDEQPIRKFESAFAEWNGSSQAFSFLGARVALSAAIYALQLAPGDEVIIPGYTCVVVPNAFQYAGVHPVYCDIELETWGIEVESLESRLTAKTRAIVIQHLFGLVCRDYEAILDLANRRGIFVIEDCAHSTGAVYQGIKVGNRGAIGIYSTEQSKVLNTTQGGLAVTGDRLLAQRLAEFQSRAAFPEDRITERLLHTLLLNYYENKAPGRWWRRDWMNLRYGDRRVISTTKEEEAGVRPDNYGLRMPAPLATVGLNQLSKLDALNEKRREAARLWAQWCLDNGWSQGTVIRDSVPVFLRYPVLVKEQMKQDRRWAIRELNVDLGVWFLSQRHPVAGKIEGCPNAEKAVNQCVNFPTLLS